MLTGDDGPCPGDWRHRRPAVDSGASRIDEIQVPPCSSVALPAMGLLVSSVQGYRTGFASRQLTSYDQDNSVILASAQQTGCGGKIHDHS
jgi:hypothetical protein